MRYFIYRKRGSAERELLLLKSKPARYFEAQGRRMALSLFSYCARTVPAYRSFLKKKGVSARSMRTMRDFSALPLLTKTDYLRSAGYKNLFPDRRVTDATTVSATSGSTGEPFFFPRDERHDFLYERALELFLLNQWDLKNRRTLAILGFGLGIWIGGIFTYKNLNALSRKGYPLTVIPVGVSKDLFLTSFEKFAPYYDQIILMGYPPFMKDLLDAGKERGIDWSRYRLRILTAAEGYSEKFRNYLAEKTGIDPMRDMVNIYGTVEQGTIAHETSLANVIRKLSTEDPALFKTLFPRAKTMPTLAQYHPSAVYFEEVDGTVVATGYGSSIPLVRYAFSDLGGVIPFDEMMLLLKKSGVNMKQVAKKYDIRREMLNLPFVYVYARADFAIVFQGANIYPDEIRSALDSKTLSRHITGRCAIARRETRGFNQELRIYVELKKGVAREASLAGRVRDTIVRELRARNSEFANNYAADPKGSTPIVALSPYQDPRYFGWSGKQRWVVK